MTRFNKRISLFCLAILSSTQALSYQFPPKTYYNVCFTPGENCTRAITAQIHRAKKTIQVQGYSFTSFKIARALVKANKKGINVQVILDKSNFTGQNFSQAKYLIAHHIPVWDDSTLRVAHNKVMIFDKHTVETGSFNFTYGAQHHNAENVLIIDNTALASRYLANWHKRLKASRKVD